MERNRKMAEWRKIGKWLDWKKGWMWVDEAMVRL